jgi:hypothetical protein
VTVAPCDPTKEVTAMDQPTPATPATPARRGRRTALAAALVAAGVLGGGVLAGTLSASADATATPGSRSSSSSTGSSSSSSSTTTQERGDRSGRGPGAHGPAAARGDETVLTGSDAEKVKAAALAAVPGGTVHRVETDAGDGEYEAHMTKADGTEVTVKLDAAFAVVEVQDGMGQGDRAPAGQQGGSGQGTGSGTAPSASANG